jgi:group I intron endonuclease
MGIIYKATNTTNGSSYIGATRQTINHRRWVHECKARKGVRCIAFHWALREYGADNFEWRVLHEVPDDQLRDAEIAAIRDARERGERLYNVSGGPGSLGVPHSEASKGRMSAARAGRPLVWFDGKSYEEWAAELGTTYTAIRKRIDRHGSPHPHRKSMVADGKNLNEWAAELGVCYHTVRYRYRKFGHPKVKSFNPHGDQA